ncbi:hypothetical protein HHUSO_G4860 [Huso huso]|uniref:HTH CENPB-type domain-containing protein n=1 Tax=Huso huso TaxID=61971 RepID=A0ABR0ZZV0_HUSHU
MPRTYKRRTNRGTPQEVMERATKLVIEKNQTIRSVAKNFDICHVSLSRFVKKTQMASEKGSETPPPVVGYKSHRVFNEELETALEEYLIQTAELYCGLTPNEVRKLAYQCAVHYKLSFPQRWSETGMAGPDWFTSFQRRHPGLTKKAHQTSNVAQAQNNQGPSDEVFPEPQVPQETQKNLIPECGLLTTPVVGAIPFPPKKRCPPRQAGPKKRTGKGGRKNINMINAQGILVEEEIACSGN